MDSKLYPWMPVRYFETVEAAVAYANEVEGYRQLWQAICWAEQVGWLSEN